MTTGGITNGAKKSFFLSGLCCVEISLAQANENDFSIVHITNFSGYSPLSYLAKYVAERGYICLLMMSSNEFKKYSSVISIPDQPTPLIIEKSLEGRSSLQVSLINNSNIDIKNSITSGLWQQHTMLFTNPTYEKSKYATVELLKRLMVSSFIDAEGDISVNNHFTALCIKPFNILNLSNLKRRLINTILMSKRINFAFDINQPKYIKDKWKNVIKNGLLVDDEVWEKLEKYAKRVLIPSTERSHQSGAG